ncbi:hypothetical protein CPB83DRAFT_853779 [Crepidotus variabilis]|uniref:Transmembrane protein n=1 Tax=Crepidotus variabilis TaxID=179855 RepID=A0A9P6JQR0_9AGAR|nr:hypothetical protein CPB83DRAFT_853779 [Crepidotus variabilis]
MLLFKYLHRHFMQSYYLSLGRLNFGYAFARIYGFNRGWQDGLNTMHTTDHSLELSSYQKWRATLRRLVQVWKLVITSTVLLFPSTSIALLQIDGVADDVYPRALSLLAVVLAAIGGVSAILLVKSKAKLRSDPIRRQWREFSYSEYQHADGVTEEYSAATSLQFHRETKKVDFWSCLSCPCACTIWSSSCLMASLLWYGLCSCPKSGVRKPYVVIETLSNILISFVFMVGLFQTHRIYRLVCS